MPDSLLTVLRLLLLSLIWLFFLRVLGLLAAKPRPVAAVSTQAPPAPAARGAGAAPTKSTGKASLRIISSGPLAGTEFTVGDEATVGRGQGCQVRVSEPMVSQLHARLYRDAKGFNVEDLGSTNGTYLNGRKVGGPARLKKGDRLRVGPIEFEVLG